MHGGTVKFTNEIFVLYNLKHSGNLWLKF